MMPIDGTTRYYNWEDVICLILKDMGLDPQDRKHHELWYLGSFAIPEHPKDTCIRVTKYEQAYEERLNENVRDKI